MSLALAPVVGALLASSSKSTNTSGGSATFLIVLILLGLAGYFLFLRPQQQKARKQRAMQSDIGVGDEILTVGGIVGTVLAIDSERVTIVTGIGHNGSTPSDAQPARMVLVRNAIARKLEPVVATPEEMTWAEGGHPGYGGVPEEDGHAQAEMDATREPGASNGGPKESESP